MANEVNILLKARDLASKKLKNVMKNLIGLGVGYLSVRMLTSAVKGSVQAFNVQEAASKKLSQALIATGHAAGFTAAELEKYAGSLQDSTTYGDEAIAEMMSILATFKNVQGPAFKTGTELILDMSTALNQDLKSSAIQLGKALNDPITGISALRRVGIQLTAEQEKQIKSFMAVNDLAAAQGIILGEVAGQFGGQAAAAAQTFGGQLKQLSNAFGDAREQIGKMITQIPGLSAAMGFLEVTFKNFGLAMDIVWTAAGLELVKFWERLKHTIGSIGPLLTWLADNWKNIFQTIWSFTKSVAAGMYENLKNFFSGVWSFLKGDGFDFTWTGLLDGFESTLTELPDILHRNIGPVEKALSDELAGLKTQFKEKLTAELTGSSAPTGGKAGGGGSIGAAASTAAGKVQAIEARFLGAGAKGAKDYAKETAGLSKRQVDILEKIDEKMADLAGKKDQLILKTSFS